MKTRNQKPTSEPEGLVLTPTLEPEGLVLTPTFVRFDAPGYVVKGRLIEVTEMQENGYVLTQYTVMDSLGLFTFNGTYQLNKAMKSLPLGVDIKVEYLGEEQTKQWKVKTFKVTLYSQVNLTALPQPSGEPLIFPATNEGFSAHQEHIMNKAKQQG